MTEEEYPGSSYPPYCAGWAYVTNPATMAAVLQEANCGDHDYFWIDDVFVTGIVRPKGTNNIFFE